MGLYKDYDDHYNSMDYNYSDDSHDMLHKKRVRRMLEDKLERKRLKEALEDFDSDLDDEFNWDDTDK
jgi:ABC-type phosphate transport system auxiliary subunit